MLKNAMLNTPFTIKLVPQHPTVHGVAGPILELNREGTLGVELFTESIIIKHHLVFIVIACGLLVCWLLVCAVYYFVESSNRKNSKFVHLKEFEDVRCFVSSPLFFFLVFSVILCYNEDMPVTLLEEVSFPLEEIPPSEAVGDGSNLNPLRNANPKTIETSVLAEIRQIMIYFKKEGYTTRQIYNTLNRFPDSFWSLGYWEKIAVVEASLHIQKEDEVVRQGSQLIAFSVVLLLVLMLIERFAGV
jgi:hypothetical protein